MAQSQSTGLLSTVLSGVPPGLVLPLLKSFDEIVRNFREGRWEPSELNGGKLCECVYSILRGHVDGKFPTKPSKPKNMVDACLAFGNSPSTFSRSIRIQIPRVLVALYEIRNNRGVGHVGGDLDANHMDAVVVLSMAKWMISELIRMFHNVAPEAASEIVNTLSDRTIPLIWEVGGKLRVLNPKLTMKEKTLALLYASYAPVDETELREWVEYSNASVFRRDILVNAHKSKLIEYDRKSGKVHLSPLGMNYVEQKIGLELS